MPAQIPRSLMAIEAAGTAAPPPPPTPGLLEQIGASFRVTADESDAVQRYRRDQAYMPLFDALKDAGLDPDAMRGSRFSFNYGFGQIGGDLFDYDRIWDEAQRRGIAGLPASQEEFDRAAYTRGERRGQDQEVLARGEGLGSIAAQFGGAMGGSFADPVNIATLPIGGGGRLWWQRVLSEAAVGAATEAVTTPQRVAARNRMGEETSLADIAAGVAAAGAGAGALRGAFDAALPVARRLTDMVNARLPDLPAPIRDRWQARQLANQEPLDDPVLLADLTEAIVGSERFSDLEEAAVAVARREGRQAEANPFRTAGESTSMHEAMAAQALQQILEVAPLPGRAVVSPASYRPATARAQPSPAMSGDAETRFMARVRQAESGGNDAARASTSSATGRYQFTDGTWLAYYKRRFGSGGLSNAQILARRGDGELQDQLMRDLTADNAGALRAIAADVTPGNLYLMHFAGKGGGGKVLRAAPDTPLAQVLGPRALAANPFLRGRTAGWLLDWAAAKMGGSTRAPQVDARFGTPDEVASAQAALDQATARADGLADAERATRGGEQTIADVLDSDPVPAPETEDLPAPRADGDPMPDDGSAALLSGVRALVDTKGRSLNQLDRLARDLDATPDQVRGALDALVADGTITRNGRTGKFMRKPPGGPSGPDDMIRFAARNGGLAYDGLSAQGRAGGTVGHDLRNSGHLDAFVPGVGPLLRPGGRGLDEMAELLWDAGYFGPTDLTPRPTEAELIDLLDQSLRSGQRVWSSNDAMGAGRDPDFAALEDFYGPEPDDLAPAIDDWGRTPEEVAADASRWAELDEAWDALDPAELEDFAGRRLDELLDDALREAEDATYDQFGYSTISAAEAEAAGRADGGDGRTADAANPDEGATGAGNGSDSVAGRSAGPALDTLAPEQRTQFLDPDAEAARQQADSLDHDFRAQMEGAQDDSIGPFGPVFTDVDPRNWLSVVNRLRAAGTGEVREALSHPSVGPIDVAWGSSAAGLRHIAEKHPEVVDNLPTIIGQMSIASRSENRVRLESSDHTAVVRLDWDGQEKTWLLTTFRKDASPAAEDGRVAGSARDGSPDAEAEPDISDLRAVANPAADPALAGRQRQEAQLGAAAPMRTLTPQQTTNGFGLFGAADGVRLDADGELRPVADLLDELDSEAADLKAIRDCL